ncbi:hypothetical protein E2C01_096490 [Portunus trituberculatus]|uniref:Uncharacterized protein n=1 Tax=Portunus trituberculatus TaxID=210409 RepID=A0A5B7K1W1_PORTR|nr:hypothetical protein [Portunus trituberculatus]
MGVRGRRKSWAGRTQQEGRHADSKIRRAVSMKTVAEDNKRCNTAVVGKRLKTIRGEEVIRRKALCLTTQGDSHNLPSKDNSFFTQNYMHLDAHTFSIQ